MATSLSAFAAIVMTKDAEVNCNSIEHPSRAFRAVGVHEET
jgi:hypothetical protein